MSLGRESRWNLCPIISVVDAVGLPVENERVGMPYDRALVVTQATTINVSEYMVRAGDTWANISARAYKGRSDLWWVIAEWSNVKNPLAELVVGRKLIIPSFELVMFNVLAFDENKKGRPSDRGA
jgi:nucleoid-associated protein YgaU